MEIRKIQRTGGASFIVSLPKDWVVKKGLKAGDGIHISQNEDGSLLLDQMSTEKTDPKKKNITISEEERPDHLLRKLIATYLAGYRLIELRSKGRISPDIRKTIREFTGKVIGPEIIEETMDMVVLQDISDPTELPQDKCLRRMYLVAKAMLDDAMTSLKEMDCSLAEDVISRDSEIDKLCWVIAKQYNIIVMDQKLARKLGVDSRKSLYFKLAAKVIERIADHTAKICMEVRNLKGLKFDPRISEEIADASKCSLEILDGSVSSLFGEDVTLANESIDMGERLKTLAESLVRKAQKIKNESAVHLVSIVESVRRTGLYATDIAEIAINQAMDMDK